MIIMKLVENLNISCKTILKIFGKILRRDVLEGENINKFENEFKNFIGVKHAISTSSGRYALYIILKSMKITKGVDEIIVPALTPFIVAKVAELCGLKLVFADVDPRTLNIDPEDIEKKITKNTKFLLVVHLHGIPCDMEKILQIVKKNNLFLIEDCAQAIGGCYGGKKVGSFGDASIFSFNIHKTLTTLGGGMVVTNNDLLNQRIRNKKNQLPFPKRIKLIQNFIINIANWLLLTPIVYNLFTYHVLKIQYKIQLFYHPHTLKIFYRTTLHSKIESMNEKDFITEYGKKFTNLQALIGLEGLKNYNNFIKLQNKNLENYNTSLKNPMFIPEKTSPVLFLYYTFVENPQSILIELFKSGFLSPHNSYPYLPDLKTFHKCNNDCHVAFNVRQNTLYLPIRLKLKEKHIMKISKIVNKQYNIVKNKHISLANPMIIKNLRDDVIRGDYKRF